MTRRPYITEPLQAIIGAIYHNIMFVSRAGNNLVLAYGDGEFQWYEEFITDKGVFKERYHCDYFGVNKNSLPLLESVVGDIAWWSMHCGGSSLGEATPMLIMQGGCDLIIQRNGLPFPKIEHEEIGQ